MVHHQHDAGPPRQPWPGRRLRWLARLHRAARRHSEPAGPLELPRLPEWAISKRSNNGQQNGKPRNGKLNPGTNGNGTDRNDLYHDELVSKMRRLSEQLGVSLSREVLRRLGGTEEVESIRDIAKLTMVIERIEDLARGVARLNRAHRDSRDEPHWQFCTEMKLPGDSISDIPTCEVLKRLIKRMKALVQGPVAERLRS